MSTLRMSSDYRCCSKSMLRRVQRNDSTLTYLALGGDYGFKSTDQYDYSRLGAAIEKNTHLKHLIVMFITLDLDNNRLFDGLEHNSSINSLELICDSYYLAGWRFNETLMSYQANNNLTSLKIERAGLDNGGDRVITTTLRACTNLKSITINECGITDEQLVRMVEAMRGIHSLEEINLNENNIGNVGCQALVTLLRDPSSTLHELYLQDNIIGNNGVESIADSLVGNNKLTDLYLAGNPFHKDEAIDSFSEALCDKLTIGRIMFSSNHNLENLGLTEQGRWIPGYWEPDDGIRCPLFDLLNFNRATNKRHVAIRKVVEQMKKIAYYHQEALTDKESLYDWDANGEWTLKSLPYVIDWYDRALVAVHEVDDDCSNDEEVPQMKLSAVYEFAKAMPLLFVPASHKVGDKKRKR